MPDDSSHNPSFDAYGRQIIDPTTATMQVLQREIASVKELLETRLVAMDRAVALLQANVDKSPTIAVVSERVSALSVLYDEKFRSVSLQFVERDTRTEQLSLASKVAVDAALQAAKEAVGEQNKMNSASIAKSEAGFTKQIDQIGQLIAQQAKGSDDKIDDMKQRMSIFEGRSTGSAGTMGWVVGAIGLALSLATLAMLIFDVVSRRVP